MVAVGCDGDVEDSVRCYGEEVGAAGGLGCGGGWGVDAAGEGAVKRVEQPVSWS